MGRRRCREARRPSDGSITDRGKPEPIEPRLACLFPFGLAAAAAAAAAASAAIAVPAPPGVDGPGPRKRAVPPPTEPRSRNQHGRQVFHSDSHHRVRLSWHFHRSRPAVDWAVAAARGSPCPVVIQPPPAAIFLSPVRHQPPMHRSGMARIGQCPPTLLTPTAPQTRRSPHLNDYSDRTAGLRHRPPPPPPPPTHDFPWEKSSRP